MRSPHSTPSGISLNRYTVSPVVVFTVYARSFSTSSLNAQSFDGTRTFFGAPGEPLPLQHDVAMVAENGRRPPVAEHVVSPSKARAVRFLVLPRVVVHGPKDALERFFGPGRRCAPESFGTAGPAAPALPALRGSARRPCHPPMRWPSPRPPRRTSCSAPGSAPPGLRCARVSFVGSCTT